MSCQGVIWITGLPGSGKTTFAKQLKEAMADSLSSPILLDGDQLREVFVNFDYTPMARLKLAYQYAKLAHMLADQGHCVIVSTVSLFHEIHAWNRKNNRAYLEVFLNPSRDILETRNQKSLYTQTDNKAENRVGIDWEPEYPRTAHYVFTEVFTSDDIITVKHAHLRLQGDANEHS